MNAPTVVRTFLVDGEGEKSLPIGSEVRSLPYSVRELAELAERERVELEAHCMCGHERGDHLDESPHGCERPCIEPHEGARVAYVGSPCACVAFRPHDGGAS